LNFKELRLTQGFVATREKRIFFYRLYLWGGHLLAITDNKTSHCMIGYDFELVFYNWSKPSNYYIGTYMLTESSSLNLTV